MPCHWLIRISKNFVPIERSKLGSWSINFCFGWFAGLLAGRWSFRTTWLNRWQLSKSCFRTSGRSRWGRRSLLDRRWQRWRRWRWRWHRFRSITCDIILWCSSNHFWRWCGINWSFKTAWKALTHAYSRMTLIILVKWTGRNTGIGWWTWEQNVACYSIILKK